MNPLLLILDAILVAYLIESSWIKTRQDDWVQTGIFTVILGIATQSILIMIIWLLKIPIIFTNVLIANVALTALVLIPILLKQKKRILSGK